MNKMLKKVLPLLAAGILLCPLASLPASAEIFTEETGGGKADSVYIAGHPDRYPIEYFDSDSGTYQGLIPQMLQQVSEQTGIDFTYLSAGTENRQQSLAKNRQVELVTAISDEDLWWETDKIPVLTTQQDGASFCYYIGFTDVLSQTRKEQITTALNEITSPQKAGLLLAVATEHSASPKGRFWVVLSVIFVCLLAAAILIPISVSRMKKKNRLSHMIDPETGIGNGDYFVYAFENLISEPVKNLYQLAFIAFDPVAFEERRTGVSVKEVEGCAANQLHHCTASTEYLSRIDTGAFIWLFQGENEGTATERMTNAVAAINQYLSPLIGSDDTIFRGGCCRLCDHMGVDAETALYHAKQGYFYAKSHHLPVCMGSQALSDQNKKAEQLSAQIDEALQKDEFNIHLQLIADGKTGEFCGAEVLSRWHNSQFGWLRPNEYMGILTQTGKIVAHDYNVFEKVCRQLEIWSRPPFDRLFLTCNFTRLSISNQNFSQKLSDIAQKYQFAHERLVIEITEDAFSTDSQTASENMKRISDLGFPIAIDDMGAGFSSLADIYDNEIDIVKIERDFLTSCVTPRRRQMLSDIITLVHHAGAKVICEGIETDEQLTLLKDIGCDMMQGFYYSRVLPLPECERFFLEHFH